MRSHHRALSDVEAASSFREIGDNQREQRAIEPGTYTIEQLHANKPMRIVREGVKHTANRQNEEAGENPQTGGLLRVRALPNPCARCVERALVLASR